MAIILREQFQSKDATSIIAGMLRIPQGQQQPQWGRYLGKPLPRHMDDTPNFRALNLLQHLDELGTDIYLTPKLLTTEKKPTPIIYNGPTITSQRDRDSARRRLSTTRRQKLDPIILARLQIEGGGNHYSLTFI